jgi:hypothetical protein
MLKELGHDANVHEKTVQRVASANLTIAAGRRRSSVRTRSTGCHTLSVDSRVWNHARGLTQDPLCIQVVAPGCVIVHNTRRWRNGR